MGVAPWLRPTMRWHRPAPGYFGATTKLGQNYCYFRPERSRDADLEAPACDAQATPNACVELSAWAADREFPDLVSHVPPRASLDYALRSQPDSQGDVAC